MDKGLNTHRCQFLPSALNDVRETLSGFHIVMTMGWWDVATRYKRSKIGAFWITIGMAVTITAIGMLFGNLFAQPMKEYLPYLSIGTVFWTMLNVSVSEGGNAFVLSSGIILQVKLPLFLHVLRVLWRNLIILGHNLIIIPFVFLYFMKPVSFNALLVVPGFLVFVANISWIMLVLAILCARFRDLSQIVQNLIYVVYFITPIMWDAKSLPERVGTALLDCNPFYHLISLVRMPLMSETPGMSHWTFCLAMMIIGWFFTLVLFEKYLKRIAYWV